MHTHTHTQEIAREIERVNWSVFFFSLWLQQFTVVASDQSEPVRTAKVGVQISVSRDQYPPTTTKKLYQTIIDENEQVGRSPIIRIIATDPDLKVT